MPSTNGYGSSGVTEIIASYRGKFIGIECKANGNKPTALQEKNLNDIKNSLGQSLVIDEKNVDMLELFIKTGESNINKN